MFRSVQRNKLWAWASPQTHMAVRDTAPPDVVVSKAFVAQGLTGDMMDSVGDGGERAIASSALLAFGVLSMRSYGW